MPRFNYWNKRVDTRQIGREFCVRYVLEGSVRRADNRVRVSAQLIDVETDTHLWAERFDSDAGDLFALQDEITSRIAVALNLELVAAEAAQPTEHPDALDYILRGRTAYSNPPSREKYPEVIGLFERALEFDPRSVAAQGWLATVLIARVLDQMSPSATVDIARAEGLAGQTLAASPRSPLAHCARGQVLRAQRRHEEAIPEYETVIAFNRNRVGAISALADCKSFAGPIEEVIPLQEQALRLSPRDPLIGNMDGRIGRVHLLQLRIGEAVVWSKKARSANPGHPGPHAWLASAYALKGDWIAPPLNSPRRGG
jgi:tetratricopeptide (TPR) repeat protein